VAEALRALLGSLQGALAAADRLEPEVRLDAAREAEQLVSAVLDWSPGELRRYLALGPEGHSVDRPTAEERTRIEAAARRRIAGEPLAYTVGTAPFRHLVLAVDARVLIPRPETEVVVEAALEVTARRPGGIAVDIGTGSGAIAISLATEGQFDQVIATDISNDALAVASANAQRLGVSDRIHFRAGADLAPLTELPRSGAQARVVVSNPPYIAYDEAAALPASVRDWEPAVALFADDRGMARYQALLAGAPAILEPGGWIVLEVDATRAAETAALARQYGYAHVALRKDLAGRDRVLLAQFLT
jgi:release factor glutamine methyltransferase